MIHFPPASTTVSPAVTTVTTKSGVTAAETSKSSSTVASLKMELSKRRFTEEKEEDYLPENLLGYQVTSVNLHKIGSTFLSRFTQPSVAPRHSEMSISYQL